MTRLASIIEQHVDCDFVDINCGCPIDLIYKRGMGCGLMGRKKPLEVMCRAMSSVLSVPLTVKMRTGIYLDKRIAHTLIPDVKEWGVDMVTLHGRSREQRYYRLADWDYAAECVKIADPMPLFGNGDVMNYEDYYAKKESSGVAGIMFARGALIKPWVFTEVKEKRNWDISGSERMDFIRDYANYGLEHWGSDSKGVETTRRFLLEWLSFQHRYVPCGLLENPPQMMNQRIPKFTGRNDVETLLGSASCADWVKISELFLGKVPDGFAFEPKHRAHGYK
jgi:tRNA-dihydrouridine synthase 3